MCWWHNKRLKPENMPKGGNYLSSAGSGGGSCEQHTDSLTDVLANPAVEMRDTTMSSLCSALLMNKSRCINCTNTYSLLLPL